MVGLSRRIRVHLVSTVSLTTPLESHFLVYHHKMIPSSLMTLTPNLKSTRVTVNQHLEPPSLACLSHPQPVGLFHLPFPIRHQKITSPPLPAPMPSLAPTRTQTHCPPRDHHTSINPLLCRQHLSLRYHLRQNPCHQYYRSLSLMAPSAQTPRTPYVCCPTCGERFSRLSRDCMLNSRRRRMRI